MVEAFAAVCREVLPVLRREVGLPTWLVTTRIGAEEVPLEHIGVAPDVMAEQRWSWAESPAAGVLTGAAPPLTLDVATVPAYARAPLVFALGAGALVAAPLRAREQVFGGLYGAGATGEPARLAATAPFVQMVATVLAWACDAERRTAAAEEQALLDPLTGLVNRRGWQQLLAGEEQRCARYGTSSGIVVIDLDDFKRVNDTLGHDAGDQLLIRTADVLTRGSRAGDTVARLGGDEFTVLAVETDRAALAAQVRRLRGLLRGARVRASLGWAVRDPGGGLTAAWLAADEQMYRAKRARRARIVAQRGLQPAVPAPRSVTQSTA